MLIGRLASMGVQPKDQGNLYWFQVTSMMEEYSESRKFQASIAGAKLR